MPWQLCKNWGGGPPGPRPTPSRPCRSKCLMLRAKSGSRGSAPPTLARACPHRLFVGNLIVQTAQLLLVHFLAHGLDFLLQLPGFRRLSAHVGLELGRLLRRLVALLQLSLRILRRLAGGQFAKETGDLAEIRTILPMDDQFDVHLLGSPGVGEGSGLEVRDVELDGHWQRSVGDLEQGVAGALLGWGRTIPTDPQLSLAIDGVKS